MMIGRENFSMQSKTFPSDTLSTKNFTETALEMNPYLYSKKTESYYLRYVDQKTVETMGSIIAEEIITVFC
jgi:hypothetical protein